MAPNTIYVEISVHLNIEIASSMQALADHLIQRKDSFVQQRLLYLASQNNRSSFVIDGNGAARMSRNVPMPVNQK